MDDTEKQKHDNLTDEFAEDILFERIDEAKEFLLSLDLIDAAAVWTKALSFKEIKRPLLSWIDDSNIQKLIEDIFCNGDESYKLELRRVIFSKESNYVYNGPRPEKKDVS